MSTQPSLFDAPPKLVTWHRKLTPAERFQRFHAEHPEIYRMLCEKARAGKQRGMKRYGMRALWEAMRWGLFMEGKESGYRFNDHFPPFYARLLMAQEPDLKDFFELRSR